MRLRGEGTRRPRSLRYWRPRLWGVREAPLSPRRGWAGVFSAPEGSSASASGRVGAGCRREAGDASTGVALRAL